MEKDINSIAIITENNEKIKYKHLKELMTEFSSKLSKRKNTVIIIASNTIGSVIGYLGCMNSGNVPLMLNGKTTLNSVLNYIEDYKCNYLWYPTEWMDENYNRIQNKYEKIFSKYNYTLVRLNKETADINNELALLLTTSGTTGSRKLVRISKKNIYANTKAIVEYMDITKCDKAITSLPMNYTYGLSVLNSHLYAGGTILLTDKPVYSNDFWRFFSKYSGTFFAGVPYTFEVIRKLKLWKDNINSLRMFTVAGGKIESIDEEYFSIYAKTYKKIFLVMYGQTEATARISYRPQESLLTKKGSVGISIPKGRMWIENSRGQIIDKPYIEGEIMYQGENVAMGYAYNCRDLAKGYEWQDILHTKDMGYKDEEGYFYVVGRNDRCVKLNGNRIDLEDIENQLVHKHQGYSFKCSIEKCMDLNIQKRLKIEVSGFKTEIDINKVKRDALEVVAINPRLIKVVIL